MNDADSVPFPQLHDKETSVPFEMFSWVQRLHQLSGPAELDGSGSENVFELMNESIQAHPLTSQEKIANALQDAESVLDQARREAILIAEQAKRQGFEEGYQDGERQWLQAIEETEKSLQVQLEQFKQQLHLAYQNYLNDLEREMFNLTLQIARKVVKEEVRQNPDLVLAVIQDALRRVRDSGSIRVRVNPLDLSTARKGKNHLLKVVEGSRGFEIIEDRRVDPGSCVIDTEHGIIDARLRLQLDAIERGLLTQPTPHQEVMEAHQDAA